MKSLLACVLCACLFMVRPAAGCDTSHCAQEYAECAGDSVLYTTVYSLVGTLVCTGAGVAAGPVGPGVGAGCAWMWTLVGTVVVLELAGDCDDEEASCEEQAEQDCEDDVNYGCGG